MVCVGGAVVCVEGLDANIAEICDQEDNDCDGEIDEFVLITWAVDSDGDGFGDAGGVGVGASSVAAPVYISEISTAQTRGRLTAMYQFNIVFGILIAFISNYLIGIIFDESIAWRWMLGIEGLPALIYTIMVFKIPNSPRWLLMKDKADALVIESITLLGIAKDKASLHLEQIKIAIVETKEKTSEVMSYQVIKQSDRTIG